MSGFGFIAELVTPTGGYRHLISPWTSVQRLSAACSRGGAAAWRVRQWDHVAQSWEPDSRPLCAACVRSWREFIARSAAWATDRLDELTADRPELQCPNTEAIR